ncbi:hypothetical protein V8F20_002700 [Naviculisporaceae sp. PSN 640]
MDLEPTYDKIDIQYKKLSRLPRTSEGHARWEVEIRINEDLRTAIVTDPLTETEYENGGDKSFLDEYLEESVCKIGSWKLKEQDWRQREEKLKDYRNRLWTNLQSGDLALRGNSSPFGTNGRRCEINIIENFGNPGSRHTIHRLAWELLESHQFSPPHENYTISVTRKISFDSMRIGLPESFRDVQQDRRRTFKILLVIARNLAHERGRDAPPDIAQFPLMRIQRQLKRSRVLVEVVRPGSFQELCNHLKRRKDQNRFGYNLVHFDMHGELFSATSGEKKSRLQFGHPANHPEVESTDGACVARELEKYHIDCVVLNACFSASCMHTRMANLSRELLRYIPNVSAMWHFVHRHTAATYVMAFYKALLVDCVPFAQAAHEARRLLRLDSDRWQDSSRKFQDDFVCVNYERIFDEKQAPASRLGSRNTSYEQPRQQQHRQHELQRPSIQITKISRSSPEIGRAVDSGSNFETGSSFLEETALSTISHDRRPLTTWSKWKRVGSKLLHPFGSLPGHGISRSTTPTPAASRTSWESDKPVQRMSLLLLDLERSLTKTNILYVRDAADRKDALKATVDRMVEIWLDTNKIAKAKYYGCERFISTADPYPESSSPWRRYKNPKSWPEPLADTLHIIERVDEVMTAYPPEKRESAGVNLSKFLTARQTSDKKHYCIFLGANNEQWWYMQWWATGRKNWYGEWWNHLTFCEPTDLLPRI